MFLVRAIFFISKAILFFNSLGFFFFFPLGNIDFPYSLSGVYRKKQIPFFSVLSEEAFGVWSTGIFAEASNGKKDNAQSSCQKLVYLYVCESVCTYEYMHLPCI